MVNLIPLPGFAISEREAMDLAELDTLCDLLLLRYGGDTTPVLHPGAESGHAVPTPAR